MARYIGMDVHATTTSIAVIGPSGRRLGFHVVETNGKVIVEVLRTVAPPRYVCIEEGTHSSWLYEVLVPHTEQTVVSTVSEKRRPTRSKSDESDAFELAEKLRTNSIKTPVFKQVGEYGKLRELSRVYTMQMRDFVRVQNRIKAIFRSRAIAISGDAIYQPENRQRLVNKLPLNYRQAAYLLLDQYDALEQIHQKSRDKTLKEAREHSAIKLLATVPGIGEIRATQLARVIITPHRFRTNRQLWKYAGLAVVTNNSSDWVIDKRGQFIRSEVQHTRGLNRDYNSILKDVFKAAATTVIMKADPNCPLYRHYSTMIANKIKPNLAKLTLARQIASITYTIWKKEEKYNPAKVTTSS
jgi:transposase